MAERMLLRASSFKPAWRLFCNSTALFQILLRSVNSGCRNAAFPFTLIMLMRRKYITNTSCLGLKKQSKSKLLSGISHWASSYLTSEETQLNKSTNNRWTNNIIWSCLYFHLSSVEHDSVLCCLHLDVVHGVGQGPSSMLFSSITSLTSSSASWVS